MKELDVYRLAIKNILWILVPFLIVDLVFGVLINGFLLITWFLLIPLSIIISIIVTLTPIIKAKAKSKWWLVIVYPALVGFLHWGLIEIFISLRYPFLFIK